MQGKTPGVLGASPVEGMYDRSSGTAVCLGGGVNDWGCPEVAGVLRWAMAGACFGPFSSSASCSWPRRRHTPGSCLTAFLMG